ncbi:hypothetical protein Fluta_2405 [Fluviicola taffensis DSM 16823]|uniref:Uncharacterized protein n=1 Tax=Fluviicola taffensis (strain DSM 16823 / NCIMB 13979 / RW262) TaxID=755732 RepID=F2ICZ7_FLUTR|nr:hypothetical protein Fluta_2405 [Fluviicola taffensis DSM 16823]
MSNRKIRHSGLVLDFILMKPSKLGLSLSAYEAL